jgi:uncharacterized membrane protein YkvA (DUF1232 family)
MNSVENNLKKIENSFKNSKEEAEKLIDDKEKTNKKLDEAFKKATANKGKLEEVWNYLQLFFSISRDYINGNYRQVPKGSIVAIIGALIYFLSPIDLIPDFIPVIGYVDDIFVLGLVFNQVKSDLDEYEIWKNESIKV